MDRCLITALSRKGIRGVSAFGCHRVRHAQPQMAQTRHPTCFEIVYLAHGMQFRAHSGSNYPMHAGQALVIPPGAPHGSGVMPKLPGTAYWLHIAHHGEVLGLPLVESNALRHGLLNVGAAPFTIAGTCRHGLETALTLCQQLTLTALERTQLRHHLLDFLLTCLAPQDAVTTDAILIAALTTAINADPELAAQPHVLAHQVHLSYSRLRARIKQATGQALGDWLLRLRIHAAMQMMAREPQRPLTDIALSLGFSSSQYFATCFRRHAAMSATRFRRELENPVGQRRLLKIHS